MTRWAAFSGGGAFGGFQARCLYKLAEAGETKGYAGAAGTSVGALAGGFIQQYPLFDKAAEDYWKIWSDLRRGQVWKHHFPLGPVHGAWTPNLLNTSPLAHLVKQHFDYAALQKSGKKVRVNAFDLETYEQHWGTEADADLAEWILASSAFPVMFAPILLKGRQYIDGGVHTVTPLTHAIREGATEVDVFLTGQKPENVVRAKGRAKNAGEVAVRTFEVLVEGVQRKDLKVAELYNRLVQSDADSGDKRVVKIRCFEPDEPLPGGPLSFDPVYTQQMAKVADRVVERVLNA